MRIEDSKRPEVVKRMSGENEHQLRAFLIYLEMGPGRSFQALARHPEISVSIATLRSWSSEFGWKNRIALWDSENTDARLKWIRKQSATSKISRILGLQNILEKLLDQIEQRDFDEISDAALVAALKTVAEQLRAETDDEPTQRSESTVKRVQVTREEIDSMDLNDAQRICSGLIRTSRSN